MSNLKSALSNFVRICPKNEIEVLDSDKGLQPLKQIQTQIKMTTVTQLDKQAPAPSFLDPKKSSNGLFSTSDNSSDFFSENSDSALSYNSNSFISDNSLSMTTPYNKMVTKKQKSLISFGKKSSLNVPKLTKSNKKTVVFGKFSKEDQSKPNFFSDWLKKSIEDKQKLDKPLDKKQPLIMIPKESQKSV